MGQAAAHRALILLVDDCADSREMYAEFLSMAFDVVQAATGAEALAKASEIGPAAIVMDLSLPDMDGQQVIERLRHADRTQHTPVVVVSGSQEPDRARGWDAYFVKPCLPDALAQCLSRLVGVHSASAPG